MNGVFLSYARSDDEPFARKLFERLRVAGFEVWFDRENIADGSPVSTANAYREPFSGEQRTGRSTSIIKTAIKGAIIGAALGAITGPIVLFTVYSNLSSNRIGEFILGFGMYGLLIGAIALPILTKLIKYAWKD